MPKTTTKSDLGTEQKKEFLRNATEVSLFIVCLGLVNELRGLEVAFKRGELTGRVFSDKANAVVAHLNEAVDATERFDIVMPVIGHGQFSQFFWRWFNWWDDYFKGLTLTQLGDIARQARERVPTVNDYRPENHWVTYRHTPAFTLELWDLPAGGRWGLRIVWPSPRPAAYERTDARTARTTQTPAGAPASLLFNPPKPVRDACALCATSEDRFSFT